MKSLSFYRDKNLAIIFYLGLTSGLPLLLTLSTLSAWLSDAKVSIETIGLFALVGLPYSLKFLWAPLKDSITIPILSDRLGHRLSWLFVTQLFLAASIYGLSLMDPQIHLQNMALMCLILAFFSASQDIVSDAYRIELQERVIEDMGRGAAVHALGYRIGMLIAGAAALYMADPKTYGYSWNYIYTLMAYIMLGLSFLCWFCPKSKTDVARQQKRPSLRESVIDPIIDFSRRQHWVWIALFILLFKLGDALATSLATPFYLELQFAKADIAKISKVFGLIAFLAGGFVGGEIIRRIGVMRGLWIGGILQLLSNFLFAALAVAGNDLSMLTLTIGVENFTSGIGGVAFVAYLSALCNLQYTASQYAILTSLMAFGRTILSSGSGYMVAQVGWVWFFVATAIAAIPGLVILYYLMKQLPPKNQIN